MKNVILCANFDDESCLALSLLSNSNQYNIVGIIASSGQISADESYSKAVSTLSKIGKQYPVFRGSTYSMVADIDPKRKVWNAQGLMDDKKITEGYVEGMSQNGTPAAVWLIEYLINQKENVEIICLGPLTDFALAIRICPIITKYISRVVIYGGAHKMADDTATAEKNIRFDPEAAAIVMACKFDKILIPRDCACNALINDTDLETSIFKNWKFPNNILNNNENASKHVYGKLLSIAVLEDETVLKELIPYSVDINISGNYSDGQTIFDTRRIFDDYNCRTSFAANKERMISVLRALAKK